MPTTSPLLPAQRSPKTPQNNASVPAKHPRPESGPTPKSQPDTSAVKRARMESSPQVSKLVIPVTPVANNKFYPKRPRKEPSFQFPSHNKFTDPKRLRTESSLFGPPVAQNQSTAAGIASIFIHPPFLNLSILGAGRDVAWTPSSGDIFGPRPLSPRQPPRDTNNAWEFRIGRRASAQ